MTNGKKNKKAPTARSYSSRISIYEAVCPEVACGVAGLYRAVKWSQRRPEERVQPPSCLKATAEGFSLTLEGSTEEVHGQLDGLAEWLDDVIRDGSRNDKPSLTGLVEYLPNEFDEKVAYSWCRALENTLFRHPVHDRKTDRNNKRVVASSDVDENGEVTAPKSKPREYQPYLQLCAKANLLDTIQEGRAWFAGEGKKASPFESSPVSSAHLHSTQQMYAPNGSLDGKNLWHADFLERLAMLMLPLGAFVYQVPGGGGALVVPRVGDVATHAMVMERSARYATRDDIETLQAHGAADAYMLATATIYDNRHALAGVEEPLLAMIYTKSGQLLQCSEAVRPTSRNMADLVNVYHAASRRVGKNWKLGPVRSFVAQDCLSGRRPFYGLGSAIQFRATDKFKGAHLALNHATILPVWGDLSTVLCGIMEDSMNQQEQDFVDFVRRVKSALYGRAADKAEGDVAAAKRYNDNKIIQYGKAIARATSPTTLKEALVPAGVSVRLDNLGSLWSFIDRDWRNARALAALAVATWAPKKSTTPTTDESSEAEEIGEEI